MPLHLAYQAETTVPVEVEGVTPEAMRGMTVAEIEKHPIYHGNRQEPLADFFRVSGDPSDEAIHWEGDLSGVHWIGAGMREGVMRVAGNAGRHVGSEMRGGEIHVEGDVSDWVGGEMHGGLIHVHGRAGHLAGSAYRGSPRGMTGGTLLIRGDAGNELGHTMRRGLLVVGGNVGDLIGFNMLAGSILVGGESGIRHGAGMRRGTLAFFGSERPSMLPSFRRACSCQPSFLPLVEKQLRTLDFPLPAGALRGPFELYNGDLIEGGRGEMLVKSTT